MEVPPHKKRKLSPVFGGRPSGEDNNEDMSSTSSKDESKPSGSKIRIQSKDFTLNGLRRDAFLASIGAYNSSAMQLQIEELLSNVRPDYERRMLQAENAIRKLKDIIERIPARDAKSVCIPAKARVIFY